ncbi:MAG: type I 3-dehydroquinate dehydratase [Thermoproteota archaeon]|nr:type I 3-dehydroquinate dehydratase [Thermoproteota archaeon]
MAARICVSIAPEDAKSIVEEAHRAFELGADYVEVRFDFLNLDLLPEALQAARGIKDRTVFTLRSRSEGGMFASTEENRLRWLYRLADQEPMLLDVELDTLKKNDELADFLEKKRSPLLVSWHDFEKTPSSDSIADVLSDMRSYSNYVKIVTMAHSIEDSLRVLELYETAIGLSPIFFAMGEAGVISRLLCTVIGNAPFTYASLEKSLAPGQLTLKQMKKLYDKMGVGKK